MQFGVADRGGALAEADRDVQLDADLPFLEVAAHQIHVGIVESRPTGRVAGEQVVAEAAPPLAGDRVEPRQQVIAAGDLFEFKPARDPALAAEFRAADERLAGDLLPIELDRCRDWFVGRTNQAAVAGREADQHTESAFSDLDAAAAAEGAAAAAVVDARAAEESAGQGVLDVFLKAIELLAGLGFFLRLAAAAARDVQGVDAPPRFERRVAGGDLGVEIAVGEVEIPVGVFDVAQQIADGDFEVGELDVGVQPSHQHAVVEAWRVAGAGNAVELDAGALQQRLASFDFEVRVPRAGEQVARGVVRVVVGVVPHGELGAGRRALGDLRLLDEQVLAEQPGAAAEEFVVQRPVVLLAEDAAGELGVERAERGVDAEARIGFDDRRIPVRFHRPWRAKDRAAEVADDVGLRHRDADRFLKREVPVLHLPDRGEGERLDGGPILFVVTARSHHGIFDLRRR